MYPTCNSPCVEFARRPARHVLAIFRVKAGAVVALLASTQHGEVLSIVCPFFQDGENIIIVSTVCGLRKLVAINRHL
jgi:hypothetical protein